MANLENLDVPIALRRGRRCSVGLRVDTERQSCDAAAPKTPHRRKKAVRFSDPGISASSGLTPMVRRTSIGTPKQRRRASTPAKSSNGMLTPSSSVPRRPDEQAAFVSLHQTADGRIERRMRRSGLREMLNKIDQERRRKAQAAQTQIAQLQAEVKARDREIYDLQNATIVIDTERIWDLEQQVNDLKEELAKKSQAKVHSIQTFDWTLADKDPFGDDDFMDMSPDKTHFGEATMAHFQASTPSRARSSFPTPPATSPTLPASPCPRDFPPTPMSHAAIQVHLPDPAKQQLEEELASLQLEVCKLSTTLESYKSIGVRINSLLSGVSSDEAPAAESSSLESLESQVQLLLQTMSDRSAALTHLTSSIGALGFPGNDASEVIMSLTSSFRAARLELEYLTPGEVTLPLSSHGAEVLDLLLTQLRTLATKAKEDEDCIDEYHEIEQSLRKQLDARVSVMDGLKAEMSKAQSIMDDKNNRIRELEIGNDRLKGAIDGYIRDISELEKLVERMEAENQESIRSHAAQQRSTEKLVEAKNASIAELEAKIGEAVTQTAELLKEMGDIEDNLTKQTVTINKRHGAALALRDARVLELRGEIDRVNESLRAAHETIRVLRVENGGLKKQMEIDKSKAKEAMDSMKEELQRVLQMSQKFLDSPRRESEGKQARDTGDAGDETPSSPSAPCVIKRPGGFLAGDLARRGSKKMRRRPDSGLGLLNEDEVDI